MTLLSVAVALAAMELNRQGRGGAQFPAQFAMAAERQVDRQRVSLIDMAKRDDQTIIDDGVLVVDRPPIGGRFRQIQHDLRAIERVGRLIGDGHTVAVVPERGMCVPKTLSELMT